jgi:serine/threonine protein kinase
MLNTPRRQLEAVIRHSGRHLARCLIRRGRYMIGQDKKNEIVVDEESMSSRHARLTVVSDDEIYIEDTGSVNGVYVDGVQVEGIARITPHSEVLLGKNTLEFQRGGLPAGIFDHLGEGFLRGNRYELGEIVVQGRTSTIYSAHDTSLDRDVALKAMLPESQASTTHALRFVREAQITSQLQHPGIPPVYELSVDEHGRLFYTTRFVEGETLAAVVSSLRDGDEASKEKFTLAVLVNAFQRICDAVAFAHSHGVLHTALRPENVVIGSFGEVFVTTWGLAKVLEPAISEEGVSSFKGIRAPAATALPGLSTYSAPEQATDSFDLVDARTDVYALGAILYRIVHLQDSIAAENDEELLSKILLGQHMPPSELARNSAPHWLGGKHPEFLAAIAMKAMSATPDDRPAEVQELQRQVAAWQESVAGGGDVNRLFKKFGFGKH